MPKWVTNISKQLIELGGNRVNQLSAGPFRDVGKTRRELRHLKCTTLLGW